LRTTVFAALCVAPGTVSSAFAQDTVAPAAAQEEDTRDVVVITGSRIARQDYVANSPIVTLGQDAIEATGVTTLDTLLNEMPQFVPAVNMTSNNPSNGGQANVSLRGLGTNRTLILMNGRRVVPSNNDGTVDINLIPAQLVQNIEVITGGASATYGSDALAGVTNFILRDIEGFEASVSYGVTDLDDGETTSVSVAAGGDFADGRGNASFMLSYNDRGFIYNANRPFSSISGPSAASPLGSTIFDTINLPTQAAITAAQPGAVNSDTFGFNNNGSLFSYINRNGFVSPGGITYDGFTQPGPFFNPNFSFNTGPLNYLALPQKRYNAFATVDYDINEYVEVYGDFLFTQYESAQELAASPAAGATTGFRVPVSNPFITTELAGILASRSTSAYCLTGSVGCGTPGSFTVATTNGALVGSVVPNTGPLASFLLDKRFTALGARYGAELYDAYQMTTGARGALFGLGDWSYDVYASYGRVDRTTTQTGNVSRSAVQRLLNATDGGASLCAGGFDWFGDKPLSEACKAYVGRTSKNLNVHEQINVEASTQGTVFTLPAGDVKMAVGVGYREDTYQRLTDASLSATISSQPCQASAAYSGAGPTLPAAACAGFDPVPLTGNDIAGFNPSASFQGSTNVAEFFAEALIPVVRDLPFVEELNLTLAGRMSDYSTVGNVEAYKADIDWTVVDGIRVRGGAQHAVRAPAIGELFAPQLLGFPNIGTPNTGATSTFSGDPCDIRSAYRSTNGAGANQSAGTNAQVEALCIAQGLSSGVIDTYTFTNQQVSGFSGGNPTLTEETADSWSLGVVWQSNFEEPLLANLSASVDYYNIELTEAIGSLAADLAIRACYNAPTAPFNPTYDPNNFYCSLFERNPLNGNIINAQSVNQNLATAITSGVDFQVDWAYDIGPGTLSVGWVGNWLENFETQALPGAPFTQFEHRIGNTGSLGSGVGAAYPEWKWQMSANYLMGDWRFGARWNHIAEMDNRSNAADSIPATGYLDLLAGWNVSDNVSLRFNINNVLDELPPTYAPAVQANTDPSTYDVLGRRYTIGLTARY
jgi:iron complex outermembrane receptor protein